MVKEDCPVRKDSCGDKQEVSRTIKRESIIEVTCIQKKGSSDQQ